MFHRGQLHVISIVFVFSGVLFTPPRAAAQAQNNAPSLDDIITPDDHTIGDVIKRREEDERLRTAAAVQRLRDVLLSMVKNGYLSGMTLEDATEWQRLVENATQSGASAADLEKATRQLEEKIHERADNAGERSEAARTLPHDPGRESKVRAMRFVGKVVPIMELAEAVLRMF